MALAMARPWKHPKTGIYWLRKRVPDELRSLLGKREEKRSLGTRDPEQAKRRHAQALAELEERWANLQAGPTALTEREAHELVAPAYEWWLNAHRDNPSSPTIWNPEVFSELWTDSASAQLVQELYLKPSGEQSTAGLGAAQHRVWLVSSMESFCREKAAELLACRGLNLDEASKHRAERAFAAAIQRASLTLAKLARGEVEALFQGPGQERVGTPDARPVIAPAPLDFGTLIAGWAVERKPMPKTIYEYNRAFRELTIFLGHSDANRLSAKDLMAWKAAMLAAGRAAKTIRDAKLAPVRAILQWAVDNHRLASNPATRVTIDAKVRAGESKRGFDDNEAAIILAAAQRESDSVKHWVPLLGAYSGARLSEICQLRTEDVLQVSGIWCMKFVPEAGSLKTVGSERLVPLHPAIVESGFLKCVFQRSRPCIPI